MTYFSVAEEPTSFTASISESNSTHVDITVSWESPGDPITDGYVIYYNSEEEPVSSVEVPKIKTEFQLTDLPISDFYNISMVGVLIGPITVTPGEPLHIAL